jgi:SAM-dependent methyltransferase
MGLKEILRLLPPQDQGLTITYHGETFPMPYHSFTYGKDRVQGLRENVERLKLFDSILDQHGIQRHSLLDVGCNMGAVAAYFQGSFNQVYGLDSDPLFLSIASKLYPHLKLVQQDLNKIGLRACLPSSRFTAVLALSMIEYVKDKEAFVRDLYQITGKICIVEGHSEDIYPRQRHYEYEHMLRKQPWKVARWPANTDAGLNAPAHSVGRPLWVCLK